MPPFAYLLALITNHITAVYRKCEGYNTSRGYGEEGFEG